MLHTQKLLPDHVLFAARRAALAVTLIAAGCLISGLRDPGGMALAADGPVEKPDAAASSKTISFNLDYVHNDALYVLALRPAELAKLSSAATIKDALARIGLFEPLGLPLEEIEEFKLAVSAKFAPNETTPNNLAPEDMPWTMMMLRANTRTIGASWGPTSRARRKGRSWSAKNTFVPPIPGRACLRRIGFPMIARSC